jgi:L-iditol 2-dehydrogenase
MTRDGGLSEYISVPADLVHPLPIGVDTVSGTFVEPLASAIKTVTDCPADIGEPVVIIGSGKIALLLAQVYDASGADVYILGRNRWQLGLARQLGLLNTLDVNIDNWKKKLVDITHGVGPRIVAEATGNTDGIRLALDLVRNGGIVNLKSMHGCDFTFDPSTIVSREITILGASSGPFEKAIEMLQMGRIEVKRLVSKSFRLEDGAKAFEYASQPSVTKVVINI